MGGGMWLVVKPMGCMGTCGRGGYMWEHVAGGGGMSQGPGPYGRGRHTVCGHVAGGGIMWQGVHMGKYDKCQKDNYVDYE